MQSSTLPMSVDSLKASGIGKTVNKLRKASDAGVQSAAAALMTDWKALTAETLEPPRKPELSDEMDVSHFDETFDDPVFLMEEPIKPPPDEWDHYF